MTEVRRNVLARLPTANHLSGSLLLCCIALAASAGTEQRTGAGLDQIPQTWTDDGAQPLTLSTLKGHRVVMTMAYSNCHRICPMVLDEFKRMQQRADARGETVDFVIVGYDPQNDSPATWHQYRTTRRLDRVNWHFLSGSTAATRQLAQQLGFPFWQMDEHVMHETRAVVFDARGIQRAFLGPPMSHWVDAF